MDSGSFFSLFRCGTDRIWHSVFWDRTSYLDSVDDEIDHHLSYTLSDNDLAVSYSGSNGYILCLYEHHHLFVDKHRSIVLTIKIHLCKSQAYLHIRRHVCTNWSSPTRIRAHH